MIRYGFKYLVMYKAVKDDTILDMGQLAYHSAETVVKVMSELVYDREGVKGTARVFEFRDDEQRWHRISVDDLKASCEEAEDVLK